MMFHRGKAWCRTKKFPNWLDNILRQAVFEVELRSCYWCLVLEPI